MQIYIYIYEKRKKNNRDPPFDKLSLIDQVDKMK
jgi:hypothetical protein